MKKINFVNGTTINGAETFNEMQNNVEEVFNGNEPMGSIVVEDIECKNLFNEVFRQGGFNNTNSSNIIYSTQNRYIKAGTYTFSTDLNISVYSFAVAVSSTPFPISGSSIDIYDSSWQTTTHTFTITQNGYLGVSIKRNDGTNIVPSDISSYHFMIEPGSVATNYVPHKEFSNKQIYSTSEQVVGTWMGKPLYRKTFNVTSPSQITSSEPLLILGSDCSIVKYDGFLNTANKGSYPLNCWFSNTDYIYSYVTNSNVLRLKVSLENYANRPITVTLEYTKTTD